MIQAPRSTSLEQFTTSGIHAANARHALEMEPRDSFVPIHAEVIAHGIPGSGFCKWQAVMEMADGTTYRFPPNIHE